MSHDSKWTEEAIFNLLDNAVKYTQAGGTINVSVAQWGNVCGNKVSDTGKEFQKAIRHLFSRGFTGKKRFIINRVLESVFI